MVEAMTNSNGKGHKTSRLLNGAIIAWMVLLAVLSGTEVMTSFRSGVARSYAFHLREAAGLTPALDPKIRIIALDDKTTAWLGGRTNPDLPEWAALLGNIAARNPRVILIDRLFADVPDGTPENHRAMATIRGLKVPVATGVFPKSRQIPSLHEPVLDPSLYSEERLIPADDRRPDRVLHHLPPVNDQIPWRFYGHSKAWEGIFPHKGHIVYDDRAQGISAFYRSGSLLIPHLAFYAAPEDSITVRHKKLWLGDHQVPLDRKGRILFNHRPPQTFYRNTLSMKTSLQRAAAGQPETFVQKDDIVLILPGFYTGNTDFHEGAPFGEIPGGFLIATVIDGILNGRWLVPVEAGLPLILLFGLTGVLTGRLSGQRRFWSVALLVNLTALAAATGLFFYGQVTIPWVLPLLSFNGTALMGHGWKTFQEELRQTALRRDFFAEKARRNDEEKQRLLLEERLSLGRTVQQLLMPATLQGRFARFEYRMNYIPSQQMSGDWLYHWEVSPTERRIFMGDVVGKGPPAAIPVAILIGCLHECRISGLSMEDSIRRLNERLIEHFHYHVTTTMAALTLHGDSGTVDFYNAGSPGWYLYRNAGHISLPLRSNPLGVRQDYRIVRESRLVDKNTMIFSFTDGYLEGSRASMRMIKKLKKEYPGGANATILHYILMVTGEGHRLEDDKSLLTVKAA